MRTKIVAVSIVFLVMFCEISFAQKKPESSKKTRYNGIYQTSEYGKEFVFKKDSTKTIKVDSIAYVGIHLFKNTKTSFDAFGRPVLSIELDENGKDQFSILTETNMGKPLAIIINNILYVAPIVQGAIPNGLLEISGFDTVEEVEKLIRLINVIKSRTAKRELD